MVGGICDQFQNSLHNNGLRVLGLDWELSGDGADFASIVASNHPSYQGQTAAGPPSLSIQQRTEQSDAAAAAAVLFQKHREVQKREKELLQILHEFQTQVYTLFGDSAAQTRQNSSQNLMAGIVPGNLALNLPAIPVPGRCSVTNLIVDHPNSNYLQTSHVGTVQAMPMRASLRSLHDKLNQEIMDFSHLSGLPITRVSNMIRMSDLDECADQVS